MGARHHRELEVWQLSNQIRERVLVLIGHPDVRRDFGFCDQTGRAASSACRKIVEGFYRFSDREFSYFLNIAYGSLGELLDSVEEARQKAYLATTEYEESNALIGRAMAGIRALRRHLSSKDTPRR